MLTFKTLQMIFFPLSLILLLSGTLPLNGVNPKQNKPGRKIIRKTPPAPRPGMDMITRSAVFHLTHEHFLQQRINEEYSSKLFDEYFKALDPSRIYFSIQDLKKFEPQRKLLGRQLRRGDVRFAFAVFRVFLQKLDEYEKFTKSYLDTKPSLAGSDIYYYNRSKVPWEKDDKALQEVWKKKIRNDLILFELMDRSRLQEEAEKKRKEKTAAKPETAVRAVKKAEAASTVKAPLPIPPQQRTLKRISRFLQYYRGLDSQDVLELYLSTLFGIYDPHSAYMSPRTVENFNINMSLSLVGIGAVLTSEDGYTKIVRIMPDGPADKDKRLKAGDRIIAVAQENADPVDIMDMPLDKVVTMIRGKEDTKVTLSILENSKGSSAVPVNITITRKKVPLKTSEVSGSLRKIRVQGREKRIGVIVVPSFYIDFDSAYRGDPNYKSSTKDVIRTFRDLSREAPLDALVIDMRSNGGGSLLEAVTLSGLFIPEGPVVQVRSPESCRVNSDQDGGKVLYAGPMAVLTNRFSASAAEIFAGAMQDYKRAVLLGDAQTHGKGSVQTLIQLKPIFAFWGLSTPAGSVKLTNSKFYRVNGASTQLKGVTPHIIFPSFTDAMEVGEDKLEHALAWDTVPAVRYTPFYRNFDPFIAVLRDKSIQRMKTHTGFQLLRKDIQTLAQIRKRKSVVLNLETRWKEYLAEKKLQEEQKQLLRTDSEDDTEKKGDKDLKKDLYLQEALAVLGDFILLAPDHKLLPGKNGSVSR